MSVQYFFRFRFVTLLLCMTWIEVQAQQHDSIASNNTSYPLSYWTNGIGLLGSPLQWHGDEWAKAGATIALTGVIISMDEVISQPFFNWKSNIGNDIGNAGKLLGSVPFQLGISGAALGAGAIAHNQPLQHFALDNLQAQVFTGGITFFVKEIAHRDRPNLGEGAYSWHGPFSGSKKGDDSFFSGHSSIAFSTATMVFLHSKKKWWVGLISYSLATGVAISRMQKEAHWSSDVVLGAILGSAVSTFVFNQQEKRRQVNQKLKKLP